LFQQLNSADYFTIYPPVCQFIFAAAAYFSPENIWGSVVIMRLFVIIAELGTLYLFLKLLKNWNLPVKNSLLYSINPLIILELTGNLHFEAILIFFLLLSFYFISRSKLVSSAASFSLAISTKVLPLIFLPLFIRRIGWLKALKFFTLITLFTFLLFLPLLSREWLVGFSSSLALYFQKFEYNGSIYYILRALGYITFGFNIIGVSGIILAVLVLILILIYSLDKKTLEVPIYEAFMWILLIFLLFNTTIHPWYIAPLVALSILTNFKFTIIWSYLIFFTYINYSYPEYRENLYVVAIEYFITFGFLAYEFKRENKTFFLKSLSLKT
jgi:alpha-1,6-mannosyltransferase